MKTAAITLFFVQRSFEMMMSKIYDECTVVWPFLDFLTKYLGPTSFYIDAFSHADSDSDIKIHISKYFLTAPAKKNISEKNKNSTSFSQSGYIARGRSIYRTR